MTVIAYSGTTQIAHEIIFNAYKIFYKIPDFDLLTDEIRKKRLFSTVGKKQGFSTEENINRMIKPGS